MKLGNIKADELDTEFKNVKIAFCVNSTERGGVEEHILDLLRSVPYKKTFIAPSVLIDIMYDDIVSTKTEPIRLDIKGPLDFAGLAHGQKIFRRSKFDIVHTHMFKSSCIYTPLAKLAGVPITIETLHGIERWRAEGSLIKRKSFIIDRAFSLLQTRFIAVSYACARDMVAIKGISNKKITVVQNGRDLSLFKPISSEARSSFRKHYGIKDDDYVFGVMARLDFQKGHEFLFEAVRTITKERDDFLVLIVGDGKLGDSLKQKVKNLGLTDVVRFVGYQRDIVSHHGIIDVQVLPSLFEGLPLGLVEAAAMEVPVIATAVDGTPEIVLHEKTGLLVPPRDPLALSRAMLYALENKKKMIDMGKAARNYVLKNFTLERQVTETINVYEQLLRANSRGDK